MPFPLSQADKRPWALVTTIKVGWPMPLPSIKSSWDHYPKSGLPRPVRVRKGIGTVYRQRSRPSPAKTVAQQRHLAELLVSQRRLYVQGIAGKTVSEPFWHNPCHHPWHSLYHGQATLCGRIELADGETVDTYFREWGIRRENCLWKCQ